MRIRPSVTSFARYLCLELREVVLHVLRARPNRMFFLDGICLLPSMKILVAGVDAVIVVEVVGKD